MPILRRALSIRQPWAELILRGEKSIEVRSIRTNIRERVLDYASLGRVHLGDEEDVTKAYGIDVDALPRGLIVGSVELVDCRPLVRRDSDSTGFRITQTAGLYAWCLAKPMRAPRPRKPRGRPQPVWFNAY